MRKSSLLTLSTGALAVVYAGLALALPADGFVTAREGIVALQAESIVRHAWLGLALEPPGGEHDPEGAFVPEGLRRTGGDLRPAAPSVLPLVASVPRALLGRRGLRLVPALCALLALLAAARLARDVLPGPQRGDPVWIGMAGLAVAATPIVWLGAEIGAATLAALLGLCAVLPLVGAERTGPLHGRAPGRGRRDEVAAGFVSGLAIGGATAAEPGALLMAPALVAGGVITRGAVPFARTGVSILCGAAAVLIPRALLHQALYGDPFPSGLAGAPVDWRRSAGALLTLAPVLLLATALVRMARRRLPIPARLAAGAAIAALLLATGPVVAIARGSGPGAGSLAGFLPILSLLPLAILVPERAAGEPARLIGWTAGIHVLLAAALSSSSPSEASTARLAPAAGLIAVAMVAAVAARRTSPGGRAAAICLAAALAIGVAGQVAALRGLAGAREAEGARVAAIRSRLPEDPVVVAASPDAARLAAALSPEAPVLALRRGADAGRVALALESSQASPVWLASRRSPAGDPALASALGRDREDAVPLADGSLLMVFGRPDGARAFLRMPKGD